MRVSILLDSMREFEGNIDKYWELHNSLQGLNDDLPFTADEATRLVNSLDLPVVELLDRHTLTRAIFAMKFADFGLKCSVENNNFNFK